MAPTAIATIHSIDTFTVAHTCASIAGLVDFKYLTFSPGPSFSCNAKYGYSLYLVEHVVEHVEDKDIANDNNLCFIKKAAAAIVDNQIELTVWFFLLNRIFNVAQEISFRQQADNCKNLGEFLNCKVTPMF